MHCLKDAHHKPSLRFLCQLHKAKETPKRKKTILRVMSMVAVILRRSINAFFQDYQSFSSIAVLLVFPASAAVLLSQALVYSSAPLHELIAFRLQLLFSAAKFPASSKLFALFVFKLTQTISAFVFTIPLALTFMPLAKAAVVRALGEVPRRRRGLPPLHPLLPLYRSALLTHLSNSFVLLSANATVFAVLFLVFNALDVFGMSSSGNALLLSASSAVLYSVVVANATVVCNLAIVTAVMDNCGGLSALFKACLLIRGRVTTALSLVLLANLGMAAVEALFQYRVVRQYNVSRSLSAPLLSEAFTIAYFHALIIVLEVIMTCMFYRNCRMDHWRTECGHGNHGREMEPEEKSSLGV